MGHLQISTKPSCNLNRIPRYVKFSFFITSNIDLTTGGLLLVVIIKKEIVRFL